MELIQHNVSLRPYNTFGVNPTAKRFASVSTTNDLMTILHCEKDVLILGGGSNLLITSNLDRLVLHIAIRGISVNHVDENSVLVTAQAGENWNGFVLWCISNNFGGLENLSLIPGNVGGCPIQNVGAYGAEVKDSIFKVEAVDILTGEIITLKNDECQFGYRDSIFKNEFKGRFVITSVTFKLTTHEHSVNTSHEAVLIELVKRGISNPSIQDISDVVIFIRNRTLPTPKHIGSGGSFFKNPIIPEKCLTRLLKRYPNLPFYPLIDMQDVIPPRLCSDGPKYSGNHFKIAAAYLIESCGFRAQRHGDAGVYEKHALVIVNYGAATGHEIFELARNIQDSVLEKFGILLEPEVIII